MDYIDELRDAIRNLHGCEAEHVGFESVKEVFKGQTVWEGEVEVFNIRGHPKAKRAYAWAHAAGEDDGGRRFVTVLELPHVDSPEKAVRAAIAQEAKRKR